MQIMYTLWKEASFVRSINPAFKFIGLLFITFILAWRFDAILNFAVFLLAVVCILLAGVKPHTLGAWMIPILILAVGMFFTGYRFSAAESMPVIASDFLVSDSHVWNGLAQASRVLAYAGIGFLFTLTTDRIYLIRSFQQQFHLPQVFAYGLLAAWGIVPQMLLEYKRTRLAFSARGIKVLPFSPALLKPLLVKSIRWSEELAISMESKGFDGDRPRTCYHVIRPQVTDWLFLIVCCVGFPLVAIYVL